MNTENTTGFKAFQATAAAIEAFVLVKLDSDGLISAADESDQAIGVSQEAIAASGYGTVRLWSAPGTFRCQAAAAITRGAQLYAAASGEVDDTGTYKLRAVALEAATAQGDIIECAKIEDASYATGQYVSTDIGTVAAAGSDQAGATAVAKLLTYVTASDGTKGVRLPAAAAGTVREVYNTVASQALKVYPATGDDINDGTTNAALAIAGKSFARFVALDDTSWAAIYTAG